MINFKTIGENSLRFIAILLACAIFVADLFFSGFNTGGILFQSLFILSLWIPSRQNNLMLAGLCTVFIVAGYWWRHGLLLESFDVFSRSISVLGIWSITIVASKKDKFLELIAGRERRIESLIEERTFDDREKFNKENQALKMKILQLSEKTEDLRLINTTYQREKETALATEKNRSALFDDLNARIQNPMKTVMGLAQKLAIMALDSEQRKHMYEIGSTSESLLSITSNYINASRIEAGQVEPLIQPFILRHCIEDVFDNLTHLLIQKNIEASYTLDPRIPVALLSDANLLSQILANLARNAVERTEHGEVIVSAKLIEQHTEGYLVCFSIHDTGPCMPPEEIEQLLKKPAGSDQVVNHDWSKMDLGLSVSTKLINMLGGKIWVEKEEGAGVVFRCALTMPKAPGQHVPLQGQPAFIGKHVLVVDDNENVCRYLNHQLKNWGMQATIFSNGPEAIKWFSANKICDVAIIDLDMPILDGLTLAHQLRQSDTRIPVLLMSLLSSVVSDPTLASIIEKPIKQQRLYNQLSASFQEHAALFPIQA